MRVQAWCGVVCSPIAKLSGADTRFREVQPAVAEPVPMCRSDGEFNLHPSVAL